MSHAGLFDKRRSSVYAGSPRFSMFVVGDYSHRQYKVVVSGLRKEPFFALLAPDDRPIMIGDTCYSLSFDDRAHAYVAMLLLNSPPVRKFLASIAFPDDMRPYKKKVLSRIQFSKIVDAVTLDDLADVERSLSLEPAVDRQAYDRFESAVRSARRSSESRLPTPP